MKKIKKILGMLLLVLTLAVPATVISEITTVETQAATTKIDTPKLVSAKAYGTSKIKFTWKRVSGVNGYAIYRKTDKSGWKRIKTITNNRTSSYTDSNLNPGTRYFYSIRAYKRVGRKNVYSRYDTIGVCAVTKKSQSQNALKPYFEVWMNSKAEANKITALMLVKNHGSKTLRIYAKNARMIDSDYPSFNRNLILLDPDEVENERLVKVPYINIAPGEESFVPFLVDGKETWYDNKTTICYEFRYDGVNYCGYSSNYTGTNYYKS